MKILLTGASGLLGRELSKTLISTELFEVTGTAFSRTSGKLSKLDLTEPAETNRFIKNLSPDFIIHAAAERRPDVVKAEPEKAKKINIGATETLAKAAAEIGAGLLFISTNYVFDGTAPPYYPDSGTNPLNTYGKMKLEGERIVAEHCPKAVILRIPILYGDVEYLGESSVTTVAESLAPEKEAFFDNIQARYPTHAADISSVICGLLSKTAEGSDICGIFHWSSDKTYTKYEMARIMASKMDIDPELIHEAQPAADAAPRPENAKLDTTSVKKLGLGSNIDFETAITRILSKHT